MNEQVRRRRVERHCAAAIRAISACSHAEYRKQQLFLNGQGVRLRVPHLAVDVLTDPIDRCRGVADSIALRLCHSDRERHQDLMPDDAMEGLIFDILEHLRTESLAGEQMLGVRRNINYAFSQWCLQSRADGLIESDLGLLIYSVIQIARARLCNHRLDEEVEGIIESVRFQLAPIIGADLARLKTYRFDQESYARSALNIAGAVCEIAKAMGGELLEKQLASLRSRNLLPPTADPEESFEETDNGDGNLIRGYDKENDYRVFCSEFDRQVDGDDLYRYVQRKDLRKKLDKMIAAQAISVPRLAQKLKNLFAVEQRMGWLDGEEEGYIDGRRLSQVVSKPGYNRVFKQERQAPHCDTIVSFLIDNSGSMKRQRYEAVTILVDVYCRALELAGVTTEILGFTTGGWTGGESIKKWRTRGSPENPGRLNDRLHIVYKDADTSWRKARYSICSMMNPVHFKEGLDGEALHWASHRLKIRIESRKCLVMISDGAPMDSATSNCNDPGYLERHLKSVAIGVEKGGEIELKAIGIGLDMEAFFSAAITVDLSGTLGNRAFSALELLFPRS